MEVRLLQLRHVLLRLAVGFGLLAAVAADSRAQSASGSNASATSKSFGSSVKEGWDKFTRSILPAKKAPAESDLPDDPVSLNSSAKAGPEVHVAVARMYEQSGKTAEAEKQYQAALQAKPNDLSAILGYARLKENLGKADEAIVLYQKAAKLAPGEAAVFNNLGLCYARSGKPDEAIAALGRAVTLQPKNALYRNNIATLLVDKGQMEQAFSHLRAVHGDAVAYYNLGYLLNKKGQKREAARHFAMSLQADPSLKQARMWLTYLQNEAGQPALQPALPVASPQLPPPMASPQTASPQLRPPMASLQLPPQMTSQQGLPPGLPVPPNNRPVARTAAIGPPPGRDAIRYVPPPPVLQSPPLRDDNAADSWRRPSPETPSLPPEVPLPQRLPPTARNAAAQEGAPLPDSAREGVGASAAPLPPGPPLNSAIHVVEP